MIYGQNFDSYIKSDLAVFHCYNCGNTFSANTYGKMDRENLPCPGTKGAPCGVQVDDLTLVDKGLNPELADKSMVTWDKVVELIADSGMWRCESCGYTAPEGDWTKEGFGDEVFATCPRCEQVEDHEILKVETQKEERK